MPVRSGLEGHGAVKGRSKTDLRNFLQLAVAPVFSLNADASDPTVRELSGAQCFRMGRRAASRQIGLVALSDVLQQKKGGLRRPLSGIYVFSIVNARPVARFRCAHRLSALHALSDTHNKRGTHSYHRSSPGPCTPRLQMPRKQVEPRTRNAWPNL